MSRNSNLQALLLTLLLVFAVASCGSDDCGCKKNVVSPSDCSDITDGISSELAAGARPPDVNYDFSEPEFPPLECRNLLVNPSAEEGRGGWIYYGHSGVACGPSDDLPPNNCAFYTEDHINARAHIYQDVQVPPEAEGKYLLLIADSWVAHTVPGSITRHPYLYGYQFNRDNRIILYMQGQNMLHWEAPKVWDVISGIFAIEPGTVKIRLFLMQAWRLGDSPDGTRAMFDDVELRVFDSKEKALAYRDAYTSARERQ